MATAWTNQLNPTKMVTFGLAKLECGSSYNIFSDEALIGGSIRFFDKAEGMKALEVIKKVSTLVAEAHNCSVEFGGTIANGNMAIPLINDVALANMAKNSIVGQLGEDALAPDEMAYASESFAKYAEIYPAVYAFVGIKNDEVGSGASHHNVNFDVDEAAIPIAMRAMSQFAYDFLKN